MRLFVALDLPDEVRDELTGLANGLPGARWLPPETTREYRRAASTISGPSRKVRVSGFWQ